MAKAIYFFCNNQSADPVASRVLDACRRRHPFREATLPGAGVPALEYRNVADDTFYLVATERVLSHALPSYLDRYAAGLVGTDLAGIVNWHQGASAPDRIFCVHTNGDVVSGTFPVADAGLMTAVLRSLEHRRRLAPELAAWQTVPEATHCSGMVHGVPPSGLLRCPCPLLDIEIGSAADAWQAPVAHDAMADALVDVFRFVHNEDVPVLFVGGTHFEPSLANAVFGAVSGGDSPTARGPSFSLGHILPNQWAVAGRYDDEDGIGRLAVAAASFRQPVRIIGVHDGLKGSIKATARALAQQLGIPLLNHRRLRTGLGATATAVAEAAGRRKES